MFILTNDEREGLAQKCFQRANYSYHLCLEAGIKGNITELKMWKTATMLHEAQAIGYYSN